MDGMIEERVPPAAVLPDKLFGRDQDAIQVPGGRRVSPRDDRDTHLTEFGKSVLRDRYTLPNETIQTMFARVASTFADDDGHAQRLYDYISNLWFMPSTPVLSNGGTSRGLPISCFLNEASDSLEGIVDLWNENVWLAARGGGIGSYWGNLRSIGEQVGQNGQTSGIIPFIRVMDSLTPGDQPGKPAPGQRRRLPAGQPSGDRGIRRDPAPHRRRPAPQGAEPAPRGRDSRRLHARRRGGRRMGAGQPA